MEFFCDTDGDVFPVVKTSHFSSDGTARTADYVGKCLARVDADMPHRIEDSTTVPITRRIALSPPIERRPAVRFQM